MILYAVIACLMGISISVQEAIGAPKKSAEYSILFKSFAANAGGQDAYSIRAGRDDFEVSVFANTYLTVGGNPLVGGAYARRFDLCGSQCWIFRAYTSLGLGVSTIGPYAEIAATFNPLSVLRIDIATHVIAGQERAILWSYPLWFGVTLPVNLPFFW
jgi:hypothetical protein